MKKKLLSVLLAATMVLSLAACGDDAGKDTPESDTTPSKEETTPEQGGNDVTPDVAPEAIPNAVVHYTFDEGAGEAYKLVEETTDFDPAVLDGANVQRDMVESADALAFADGPVGQALYLDGKHGLDLNFEPTNTDAYTVSFWMNADRLGNYGPTLQMGYNVGRADGNGVAWMNITQTDFGDGVVKFPIVWSRNEKYNSQDGINTCWPWMQAFDNEVHGKKEWTMLTVVATGEKQDGLTAAGVEFTRAQLYLDGVMVYDTQTVIDEAWEYDFCLAPDLMKPNGAEFETWFGINYWDVIYKGFIDEFYVFDSALTPGQVLSLYQLGDANVNSVAPEGAPEEFKAPITGTAIGAEDFSTGFWGAFSDGWAVASGETVSKTFVNWHGDAAANYYNTFFVVLQSEAVSPLEKSADCVEYAVVRADNFGWAFVDGVQIFTNDPDADTLLGWTLESDWNWETMPADMQGATVTVSVTNNGDTADVECQITTATGDSHFQNYKNIPISGDLAFSLGVDCSLIDLQD
ncbi:MAG: hypothetical protein J1F22_09195 [Lachnospiraceae bacterium]|nr:hypothetical protein [Lachnospiraceae bacterium]